MAQTLSAIRQVTKTWKAIEMGQNDGQAIKKNIVLYPGKFEELDPFLLMAEDWMRKGDPAGGGFETHPHRGFETVTVVIEGALEHRDSKGGHGILQPGDVQWTTTGKGVLHSEMPHGPMRSITHVLQLWLNLPRAQKFVEPRYQDIRRSAMPVVKSPDGRATARLFSGRLGAAVGPAKNHVPVIAFESNVSPGGRLQAHVPKLYNAFAYALAGHGSVNSSTISKGDVVLLPPTSKAEMGEDEIVVEAPSGGAEDLRLVFFAGKPLHEPVVQRGPFVMNSGSEINQAWADYHSGVLA